MTNYILDITFSDELYHHGILGQKWGIRRFQNPDGSLTEAGKQRYSNNKNVNEKESVTAIAYVTSIVALNTLPVALSLVASKLNEKRRIKDIRFQREDPKTKAQDKIYQESYQKSLEDLHKKISQNKISDLNKTKEILDPKESIKVVNKNYPRPGYVSNCTFCTMAMVLREKGYDVVAQSSFHGYYDDNIKSMWKKGCEYKNIKPKTSKELIKSLQDEGDGAYGDLGIMWKLGGGHSIFWKNENGSVKIYDAQAGKEVNMDKWFKKIDGDFTTYSNLKNAIPDDLITVAVKNKGE